jgi:hypothetical protein
MKMKRYLKEEDAEKLWDFGGTLQGLAYGGGNAVRDEDKTWKKKIN